MAALITGRLVADARWGMALRDPAGFVREVIWPHGYAARRDYDRLVLLDETGGVIAAEGELVEIGGGEIRSDGAWLACNGPIGLEGSTRPGGAVCDDACKLVSSRTYGGWSGE